MISLSFSPPPFPTPLLSVLPSQPRALLLPPIKTLFFFGFSTRSFLYLRLFILSSLAMFCLSAEKTKQEEVSEFFS